VGIRKGYVDTTLGQIHYKAAGKGAPIVLLHQSPSGATMWDNILEPFAAVGRRAIAFDMPGFGESAHFSSKPTMSDYARILVEAINGLEYANVDILGHHTGATVASTMAAEYPEVIRHLVCWGYPMKEPEFMARLANEAPTVFTREGSEILAYYQRRPMMGMKEMPPSIAIRLLIEKLQAGEDSNWAHQAVGVVDHEALAARIHQPTLLLCSPGDPIVRDATEAAAPKFPNARYQDLDGVTMEVADEDPHRLVAIVDSFLKE
jgi:pimeloyl-ACP methyl ester carboxylesterase